MAFQLLRTASFNGAGTNLNRGDFGSGTINRGGYYNTGTGSGTAGDKMRLAEVKPTWIPGRESLEIIGTELWQIKRLVNVIPNDMCLRWRTFETGDDAELARIMHEQEKKHRIKMKINKLAKSGRLFGSAMILVMLEDAPTDVPLNMAMIREGDLANLIIVDRFDMETGEKITDLFDPNFGKPEFYRWNGGKHGSHVFHHSRVIRYDAEELPDRPGHGFSAYDSDWGISVIVQCLLEVFRDEDLAASVQAQMLRSGTLVVGVENLQAMIADEQEGGLGMSVDQVLSNFEQGVRSHRMVGVGSNSKVDFLSPQLANISNLLEVAQGRLAAAFEIPQTRLWGASPKGLNSMGESEQDQYSDLIASRQEEKLTPIIEYLDMILAADAGLDPGSVPEFWWNPYRLSDKKKIAEVSKTKVEAVASALAARVITEEEGRASLDGDELFGELKSFEELGIEPEDAGNPEMTEELFNQLVEEAESIIKNDDQEKEELDEEDSEDKKENDEEDKEDKNEEKDD